MSLRSLIGLKNTADVTVGRNLLRPRGDADAGRVSQIELFFDLVFVFAITQVSHFLLKHLDPVGVIEAALLFIAVWWVWVYTAWVTNWLDPDKRSVRGAMLGMMLAGLLLSTSLPGAFAGDGLVFAIAYVTMQVGRTTFMLWALRGASDMVREFQRIGLWFVLAGLFWIVGGIAPPEVRLWWWAAALSIELVAPLLSFWTPLLGRASAAEWDVDASHLAERCALFVLIGLGESLVMIGSTYAGAVRDGATAGALIAAFATAAALWWIYFDTAAENTREAFAEAANRGALARAAYTYAHAVIVAGIVLTAVGDEQLLTHPHAASDIASVACLVGGPAIYLAANAVFRYHLYPRVPRSHVCGLAALAITAVVSPMLDLAALGALVSAIIVATAGLGSAIHARRRRRARAG